MEISGMDITLFMLSLATMGMTNNIVIDATTTSVITIISVAISKGIIIIISTLIVMGMESAIITTNQEDTAGLDTNS